MGSSPSISPRSAPAAPSADQPQALGIEALEAAAFRFATQGFTRTREICGPDGVPIRIIRETVPCERLLQFLLKAHLPDRYGSLAPAAASRGSSATEQPPQKPQWFNELRKAYLAEEDAREREEAYRAERAAHEREAVYRAQYREAADEDEAEGTYPAEEASGDNDDLDEGTAPVDDEEDEDAHPDEQAPGEDADLCGTHDLHPETSTVDSTLADTFPEFHGVSASQISPTSAPLMDRPTPPGPVYHQPSTQAAFPPVQRPLYGPRQVNGPPSNHAPWSEVEAVNRERFTHYTYLGSIALLLGPLAALLLAFASSNTPAAATSSAPAAAALPTCAQFEFAHPSRLASRALQFKCADARLHALAGRASFAEVDELTRRAGPTGHARWART